MREQQFTRDALPLAVAGRWTTVAVCSIQITNKNTHRHTRTHTSAHTDFTLLFGDFSWQKTQISFANCCLFVVVFNSFLETAPPAVDAGAAAAIRLKYSIGRCCRAAYRYRSLAIDHFKFIGI